MLRSEDAGSEARPGRKSSEGYVPSTRKLNREMSSWKSELGLHCSLRLFSSPLGMVSRRVTWTRGQGRGRTPANPGTAAEASKGRYRCTYHNTEMSSSFPALLLRVFLQGKRPS